MVRAKKFTRLLHLVSLRSQLICRVVKQLRTPPTRELFVAKCVLHRQASQESQ